MSAPPPPQMVAVPSGTQLMNQIGLETLKAIRKHQSPTVRPTKEEPSVVPHLILPPTLVWMTQRTVVWNSIEQFLHKRGLKENVSLIQSIFDHIYNQYLDEGSGSESKRSDSTQQGDGDDGQGWSWIMEH